MTRSLRVWKFSVAAACMLLAGCASEKPKQEYWTAKRIYQNIVDRGMKRVHVREHTSGQQVFINKKLIGGCNKLGNTEDRCDDYKAYIQSAEALHDEAVTALGADDPQVCRPFYYAFNKACHCNNLEDADKFGMQLAAVQTKYLGADSPDTIHTRKQLASLHQKLDKH